MHGHEPFRRRIEPAVGRGCAIWLHRSGRAVAGARDADVAQFLQSVDEPLQLGLGVRAALQIGNRGIDELACKANDAVVFRLNPRPGFQHQPADIDGEAQHEHQREQQVQAHPQGSLLPHPLVPVRRRAARPGGALTAENSDDLIDGTVF